MTSYPGGLKMPKNEMLSHQPGKTYSILYYFVWRSVYDVLLSN